MKIPFVKVCEELRTKPAPRQAFISIILVVIVITITGKLLAESRYFTSGCCGYYYNSLDFQYLQLTGHVPFKIPVTVCPLSSSLDYSC